ncbi:GTPase of the mitochondrial inner membrane that associates with the large ribosomal subunit [Marasmius crinis-equi]|uniref:GTPase of the mitochondrial inner membrane that associates with the large ribosomal subunit n=1 Tax=Marasmius crinis-equi TaxID=585013 RepID=A0ABR3FVB0_9AGAR
MKLASLSSDAEKAPYIQRCLQSGNAALQGGMFRTLPPSSSTFKLCKQTLSFSTYSAARNQAFPRRYEDEDYEAYQRRRKTEWKRQQGSQGFLDELIINVRGGKGGDGCVAFHREKFLPHGPPSGGNGGRGGDVYILPTTELTSLATVAKRVRGEPGGNGQGTWQNGKTGSPLIIRVPLGTVVREIPRGDPRRAKDEWEAEEEALEGLDPSEKQAKMREKRWMHYPRYGNSNVEKDAFKEAEDTLYKQERERRYTRRKRELQSPIFLDLDKTEEAEADPNAPLGLPRKDNFGHLVASGGQGGMGNPSFQTNENRKPRWATRGHEGERITLSLELKLLADIGLVGMPNAGKSTLLRAVTGGRARTEVAGYAFTTLNPVVGVVRMAGDGTFEGSLSQTHVHEETSIEEAEERQRMENGELAHSPTRNQSDGSGDGMYRMGHRFDLIEDFRFTIADNPGLIAQASENVGLGHSFLRSMERSLALVYVVDFSAPAPWDELAVLRDELEQYQPGMSHKVRMVIANKSDMLAGDGDPASIEEAKSKLKKLEDFVHSEMQVLDRHGAPLQLDVVPVSAKFSQNIKKVVGLMKKYVEDARDSGVGSTT